MDKCIQWHSLVVNGRTRTLRTLRCRCRRRRRHHHLSAYYDNDQLTVQQFQLINHGELDSSKRFIVAIKPDIDQRSRNQELTFPYWSQTKIWVKNKILFV